MVWLNPYALIPLINSEGIDCLYKTCYEYHAIGVYLVGKTTHQIACSEISDALTQTMVTPREIVWAARARREEISVMLYAENFKSVVLLYCGTKSHGLYFCEVGTVFADSVLRKRTVTLPSGQQTYRASSWCINNTTGDNCLSWDSLYLNHITGHFPPTC